MSNGKVILAIDLGFGYNKVVVARDGVIEKKFKFPSAVGLVNKNEMIQDPRIFNYEGKDWYVGEDAMKLPSTSIVDVKDYKSLEFFAPLFIYYVCHTLNIVPSVIATGLSKAHIGQSGYFEEKIKHFVVNGVEVAIGEVYVLPQGAGAKIAIDKYGDNFPNENKEFLGSSSYVGADIGFNTIDMFQVLNGKASPNLFEGIEGNGVVMISSMLIDHIKETMGRTITHNEAKEILASNKLKIRGQETDFTASIKEFKAKYLENLMGLIETKYGQILDKMDGLYLIGGGSYLFRDETNNFIKVPKVDNEYYNAIGFYLYAEVISKGK